MNPSGIARTEIEIVDLSVLINTGLKGINGVIGITERGPINKPVLVGSWLEYVREFGGLLEESDFPLICRRALEAGAKLMISRVGHYDDITDKTTITGTKADKTVGTWIFEAANEGAWGNKVEVKVFTALSGNVGLADITITIDGYPDLTQVIKDVDRHTATLTSEAIVNFNTKSKYVKIVDATHTLVNGKEYLEGGTDTNANIVATDYIGDVSSQTGIHSFDNTPDITKIAVPEITDNQIDIELANYADSRGDIIALLRTPTGIDGQGAVSYRESSLIDTWRAFMFTGDLKVVNPKNGAVQELTALGDIMGLISTRDNKTHEWFSFSGSKRGRIKNALGVVYNLGSAARQTTADLVDARGLNMVIEHPSFGVVSWGNGTLQKADTLLKHANVAELMIFLTRGLKPLVQSELFQPNDVETWRNIYRKVQPFMDYVKANRGVWDWLYQGDQDIDKVEDAVVNSQENIDAGQYIFNLFIKPKVALKYIGIKVVISNSGVSFDVLTNTNLD